MLIEDQGLASENKPANSQDDVSWTKTTHKHRETFGDMQHYPYVYRSGRPSR